jgi:hypothetical protein
VPSWRCRNGSGSLSVGRAGSPISTAPPNAMRSQLPATTPRCALSCERSRVSGHAGAIAKPIIDCSRKAGRSTANAPSGSGAKKGSGCPPSGAKRQRRGESTVAGDRLRAERPDHV